jgi:hypothetical protein
MVMSEQWPKVRPCQDSLPAIYVYAPKSYTKRPNRHARQGRHGKWGLGIKKYASGIFSPADIGFLLILSCDGFDFYQGHQKNHKNHSSDSLASYF